MKKFLMIIGMALIITACGKVPAGNVGVKINLYGSDKGVQVEELGVGRYWIGINEELYLFPTFTQNVTWADNKMITFQTSEGMKVSGAVGLTYSIDPTKATTLFQKYRSGIDDITDKFLRNMVRDAFNEKASVLKVDAVYGEGKSDMLRSVEESVRSQVKDIGINIERIYYASDLILPIEVTNSLNAKIKATQMAEQRQNEIKQSRAEADKKIEDARGVAESKKIVAEGEANAIRIVGEALRENKSVIEMRAIETWDGKLPTVMSSDVIPMLGIDSALKK